MANATKRRTSTRGSVDFVKQGLDVDKHLRDELPLVPFASSLAGFFDVLLVREGELPVEGLGAVAYKRGTSVVIVLDRSQITELGTTMAEAFAHELGHVVDWISRQRYPMGRSATCERRAERFAERMGAWLLAHDPPDVMPAYYAAAEMRRACR